MALYRESAGLVGIATGGESTYGTPDTLTHVLYCDSSSYAVEPTLFDYGSLSTGYEESTGNVITRMLTRINLSGPLCDKSAPILLTFALGGDTKSLVDTSAYQHLIAIADVSTELPSTTIQINLGSGAGDTTHGARFAGCVLDTLTISAQDGGTWTYNASFVTEGVKDSSMTDLSALTTPTILPFLWGRSVFNWNSDITDTDSVPVFDAPTSSANPTGGWSNMQDISKAVTSYSYTVNNGVRLMSAGASDGSTTRVVRSKRSQTLTVGHMYDSTELGASGLTLVNFLNKTGGQTGTAGFAIQNRQSTLAGSSYYYGLTQYIPKASLVSVTPPTGNPREFSSTWAINATSVADSIYTYFINKDNVEYY